jgi:hypothetical protein
VKGTRDTPTGSEAQGARSAAKALARRFNRTGKAPGSAISRYVRTANLVLAWRSWPPIDGEPMEHVEAKYSGATGEGWLLGRFA